MGRWGWRFGLRRRCSLVGGQQELVLTVYWVRGWALWVEVWMVAAEGVLSLIAVSMRLQGRFAGTPRNCERRVRMTRLGYNDLGLHRHRFVYVRILRARLPRSSLFQAMTSPHRRQEAYVPSIFASELLGLSCGLPLELCLSVFLLLLQVLFGALSQSMPLYSIRRAHRFRPSPSRNRVLLSA